MGSKERFYVDIMAVHPEVTGSCNLVVVKYPNDETCRFIVDCGLFQEKEYEELNQNFPFNADSIHFCLVTHNHVDHIGRIPLLCKEGFSGKIYASSPTTYLMPLALRDTGKVLKDLSKRKHCKELFSETDISLALNCLVSCQFGETIQIDEHIKATFFKNGHLIGAALILVQISFPEQQTINLLFTGDYHKDNMFLDVNPLPYWVKDLNLTIIQESTYGYMDSDQSIACFKQNVIAAIQEGKTVISLVFSLGRSQEILYVLKMMQEEGVLDKAIPIYFDGKLAFAYTELYKKDVLGIKEEMTDFIPDGLVYVSKELRPTLITDRNTKIIVTTSGMGSYGPAQCYLPEYLTRKNALIHFTGYVAEGTLGRSLMDTPYNSIVSVGGVVLNKKAEVVYTSEFSAHAKADEMIEFLQQFNHLKLVLVNHGQTIVKEQFSKRILSEVESKHVGILSRDYFFRVNGYGLIKSLGTKFD
jgi:RNA-metabolizing metallo-beta-lactamase